MMPGSKSLFEPGLVDRYRTAGLWSGIRSEVLTYYHAFSRAGSRKGFFGPYIDSVVAMKSSLRTQDQSSTVVEPLLPRD